MYAFVVPGDAKGDTSISVLEYFTTSPCAESGKFVLAWLDLHWRTTCRGVRPLRCDYVVMDQGQELLKMFANMWGGGQSFADVMEHLWKLLESRTNAGSPLRRRSSALQVCAGPTRNSSRWSSIL